VANAAERMRSYRARLANGRARLLVDVDLDRLADALVADRFLAATAADDRAAIEAAVGKMIETYVTTVLGDV
jgi:hypothetical protein